MYCSRPHFQKEGLERDYRYRAKVLQVFIKGEDRTPMRIISFCFEKLCSITYISWKIAIYINYGVAQGKWPY
jgi:hypothetical protein